MASDGGLYQDDKFDPESGMLKTLSATPGYHTRVPEGTWIHETRLNMGYALHLLQRGSTADTERARTVITAVMRAQETDPAYIHFGVWPWFAEEPCREMAPADQNWAAFIGGYICVILRKFSSVLGDETVALMRTALHRACYSIFRRNMHPGYTNIALMSAAVCLGGGRELNDPFLHEYGLRLLENFVDFTEVQGGFAEYNSPTYTMVALEEIERILMLADDPHAQELANKMHRTAWTMIAEHFHPATGQWAGPHSRAYSDILRKPTVMKLAAYTGATIPYFDENGNRHLLSASMNDIEWEVDPIPCPADLAERFRKLPASTLIVTSRFTADEADIPGAVGTTWFSENVCLASINCGISWAQARSVLGYWTDGEDLYTLRLRVLNGERDFCSFHMRQTQNGNRLLSIMRPSATHGDFHPSLDVPQDRIFHLTDLRVRLELKGKVVSGKQVDSGVYTLNGGDINISVQTGPLVFGGKTCTWQLVQEDGCIAVVGTLLAGENNIHWPEILTTTGAGIALTLNTPETGQPAATTPVQWKTDDTRWTAQWDDLTVAAPSDC